VVEELSKLSVDNVPVAEAWERLKRDSSAQLVDVRTKAEWNFVGVPDLGSVGRSAHLLEWQTYPQGSTASDFVDRCTSALRAAGAGPETHVFFLCRSGARSLSAARAVAGAGYANCHNIEEGFEGPLDENRHRGVQGWKAIGLPWIQS